MVGSCEQGGHEPLDTMTAFTFSFIVAMGKLSAVLVAMTIQAYIVRYFCKQRAALVTFFAVYFFVPSLEGKCCLRMIELRCLELLPSSRSVAPRAIGSELVVVFVLVTGQASLELYVHILYVCLAAFGAIGILQRWMTLDALNFSMFAGKAKSRAIVGEKVDRFEGCMAMALQAVIGELFAMLIVMTAQASSFEPQAGGSNIYIRLMISKLCADEGRIVAIPTGQISMLAFQLVS
ncbi:MAG: hypothetical protein ACE5FH_11785 [Candidatus Zixiibacteriota bacterium]